MNTDVQTKPGRVLKLVFSFDCREHCEYCAVIHSPEHAHVRQHRLGPEMIGKGIREFRKYYRITGLEIGAGDTFLHPEMYEWLVDYNNRHLQAELYLFASLTSEHTDRIIRVLAGSHSPVHILVSYDGRFSERNSGNWQLIEDRYRSIRDYIGPNGHITIGRSACITPRNLHRLHDNLRTVAELDPDNPRFNFRPIKRMYTQAEHDIMCAQFGHFLDYCGHHQRDFFPQPDAANRIQFTAKADWSCHRSGISLLPDGRWTDCYVTWYCSDYPAGRTLADLKGYDVFFSNYFNPVHPHCLSCLDVLTFCNQCQAGLEDYKRRTGRTFYDQDFCVLINRLMLMYLGKILEIYPEAEAQICRPRTAGMFLRREAGGIRLRIGTETEGRVLNPDPRILTDYLRSVQPPAL